jgi:hypothetical protein
LRIGANKKDLLGGVSSMLFSMGDIGGSHGFTVPGEMIDIARALCKKECTETTGENPCGCKTVKSFDLGLFLFNIVGRYLRSNGTALTFDPCNATDECSDQIPLPKLRENSEIQ